MTALGIGFSETNGQKKCSSKTRNSLKRSKKIDFRKSKYNRCEKPCRFLDCVLTKYDRGKWLVTKISPHSHQKEHRESKISEKNSIP